MTGPSLALDTDILPAIRMREELAEAKRQGLDFDAIWQRAILRVTHSLPTKGMGSNAKTDERKEWRELFADQRSVWRAAYYDEPVCDLSGLRDMLTQAA